MANHSQLLADKVAVVTGAARNIGRAIALGLADAGAAIVVNALSDGGAAEAVAGEIEAAGGRALAHIADVADEQAVAGLVEAAIRAFGRIDMLVNNAGLRQQHAFTEMTFDQWRAILAVNLNGPFLCARACVPHIAEAGGGAIVNIGGLSGHIGGARRAHVVSAKAGVVGLTKALAVELAPQHITVNCVVPGNIETVRGESPGTAPPRPGGAQPLAGRPGRPEEIAAMVCHLCAPGGRYITGQAIHVNGGLYLP